MPWYKTGTVSVVQNSNTVIGTSTAFIANSRAGDGFRGPDGGWYEVVNIASDTAMSISPNYQGATNSAGAYALAPLQGYVKDSADALRGLVTQYGAKLAALGTTGNYEILPVTKGGTGGVDQATARTSLLAAKSGANADITALSGLTTALSVSQGGTGGNTQATARSGLGLGSAAVAAIVGAVSQSGGVATGAVMDFGTFTNGFWAKFASGLQICAIKGVAAAVTAGIDYNQGAAWAFPIAFAAPPVVLAEMGVNPTVTFSFTIAKKIFSASTTTAGFRFSSDVSQTYFWDFIAIGRWY